MEILKQTQNYSNDFLDLYLKEYINDKNSEITLDIIVSNFVTFFIAGMDTTASLVSNICFYLSQR